MHFANDVFDSCSLYASKKRRMHRTFSMADKIKCNGGGGKGGGGGGSSQPSQTIQKTEPWDTQKDYLAHGFEWAKNTFWRDPPPKFYPDSTVVPFSPETNLAMNMQTDRALSGSPIQDAGTQQLTDTLSGNYLSSIGALYNNPMQQTVNNSLFNTINGDYLYGGEGFNAALDAASRRILPQIDSAFERSGRIGSGLAEQAKTQALSDAFANQYAQERNNQLQASALGQQGTQTFLDNIGRERDNQIRSMMFAPQMASLDYQDIAKLAEVGAQKESLSQQELADKMARWDYQQNLDASRLANFMNIIQGNYGGTSTTTSRSLDGGGFSPNIMGGVGGMLMAPALGINPFMGLLGGLF